MWRRAPGTASHSATWAGAEQSHSGRAQDMQMRQVLRGCSCHLPAGPFIGPYLSAKPGALAFPWVPFTALPTAPHGHRMAGWGLAVAWSFHAQACLGA
jgi:hypothetical protein